MKSLMTCDSQYNFFFLKGMQQNADLSQVSAMTPAVISD